MRKPLTFLIALGAVALVNVSAAQAGGYGYEGGAGGYNSAAIGGGGCSQATALLARMDGSQNTSAVTTLICGLVADGTWSLMDLFYVFAINSAGNAALNWVSSSFQITVNGACTFTANQGYTGNGSTCNLTQGYNFSSSATNFAQNSGSMGTCNFNAAANAETLMGGQQSGTYNEMGFSASAMFYVINDGAFPNFTFANTSGNWMASRTGATALALYLNGSSVSTSAAASLAVPSTTAIILALDGGGTPTQFSNAQIGVSFVGAGLTSGQASSVYSPDSHVPRCGRSAQRMLRGKGEGASSPTQIRVAAAAITMAYGQHPTINIPPHLVPGSPGLHLGAR